MLAHIGIGYWLVGYIVTLSPECVRESDKAFICESIALFQCSSVDRVEVLGFGFLVGPQSLPFGLGQFEGMSVNREGALAIEKLLVGILGMPPFLRLATMPPVHW